MEKYIKKRNIVIFLTIGLAVFILTFFAIYLLGKENTNSRVPKYDFIFHEVDFDTDILSDPEYLLWIGASRSSSEIRPLQLMTVIDPKTARLNSCLNT